jgi:hypothetical protein
MPLSQTARSCSVWVPIIWLVACDASSARDEVSSVPSPDGQVQAVLFGTNGGATTSFGYDVEFHDRHNHSVTVAKVSGAVRNAEAFGIDLRWTDRDALTTEYMKAKGEWHVNKPVQIGGRSYRVRLLSEIDDPSAPSGGMLYNLKRKQGREK